ncbi:MAG: energy transducer TonB [Thermodesulfobacteriota bacterium]|nr:energy transducer TonB [Thermodesulfobacteriota bacterium]
MSKNRRKPNWLLRGLIGISLGIHLVVFVHISGIYRSNALSCIELTLKDISKPPSRDIPRPRLRPETVVKPYDIKRLNIRKRVIPRLTPTKIDSSETDLQDSLVERVSMPDIPDDAWLRIAEWDPGSQIDTGDYVTSADYLEMVRLRIERYKEYPNRARTRHIEGSVTIRFLITPEGNVRAAEIVKTSKHGLLDTAALQAVKDAGPFPKPPGRFFKGEIPLELTILFELA